MRLTNALPALVSYIDADQKYRFVNERYEEWFPLRRHALIGKTIWEIVGEEAYAKVRPMVERALAGERVTFEQTIPYVEAGHRHVHVEYTPRISVAGNVEGFYALIQDVSAARAGEVALRESDARFQAITNSVDQMIWSTRPDGYHDYFNDRWYEYTGLALGSTDGTRWNAVFHPGDQERAWETWRNCLATGERYHIEYRLRHRSGEYRWVIGRAQCVRDDEGQITRWYGTCTDVHDLKTAEEQISRNHATFYNLIQNNPFGVYVVDADFRLAEASQGSQKVFEHVKPLIGRDFAEVLRIVWAEPFATEAINRFRYTLATGEPYSSPRTVEQRGDLAIVEAYDWRIERIELPDARYGVVCYFYDLSDRQRWEAELVERDARLRALTDNLPGGMVYQVTTGPDGSDRKFVFVSQSHEKLTGVAAEEVLRDPAAAYNLIIPEDRARLAKAELKSLCSRSRFDEEVRIRRADGELRWCRIISEARKQPDSSLIWDGIQIDITERKLAEQRLRELNATLEERIAQRASELAQAQEALRQSQKLESMGQLTGGVAHDFNNLLTPIIGSLDMLMRRGLGSERERRLIDGALQSAERAKTLVQRLLAFARRQPLQPQPVDVKRLVVGMADLIASTSGPQVDVRVDLPDDLPPATADANQVEMAVLNLAVNARDAMPEGGELTISAAPADVGSEHRSRLNPGDYIRLSVADTGVGMDEVTLARAIEPFFSTKGIGKGTGLGLSMVHGLALQLNGGLTIQSNVGQGTTVELWLPVSASPADQDATRRAVSVIPKGLGTALLVDDEELVRMSTADMLVDLGYEVVEASSAEEALLLVSQGLRPTILVTDHLMPGMSGAQLAQALRAQRPDLPVLIVSGYAEAEGIDPSMARLTKPFRNAELAASLSALLPASAASKLQPS